MKLLLKIVATSIAICIILIIYCNYRIENSSKSKVYNNLNELPTNKIALVLGTGKYLKGGQINPYYSNRINATVELFRAHKIEKIIVSGDHGTKTYNEPQAMKDDLVAQGIPPENIYMDYAGFRTLDSVYRIKAIFGQQKFTVVSQKFHNERAIYIADYLGLQAVGYNAKDVNKKQGFKTNIREKLARVKVFIDEIIDTKPKFLGEKIKIE